MIELTEISPEVYYAAHRFPLVGRDVIDFLIGKAAQLPRQRCRICFHDDPSDPIHEMLIVHHRSAYVRPHKHLERDESLMVVEGEADMAVFGDSGQLRQTVRLGAPSTGHPFYYRMPANTVHSLMIRSEWLVFQEVVAGPFDPRHSAFPTWAPDGADARQVAEWMQDLGRRIDTFTPEGGTE